MVEIAPFVESHHPGTGGIPGGYGYHARPVDGSGREMRHSSPAIMWVPESMSRQRQNEAEFSDLQSKPVLHISTDKAERRVTVAVQWNAQQLFGEDHRKQPIPPAEQVGTPWHDAPEHIQALLGSRRKDGAGGISAGSGRPGLKAEFGYVITVPDGVDPRAFAESLAAEMRGSGVDMKPLKHGDGYGGTIDTSKLEALKDGMASLMEEATYKVKIKDLPANIVPMDTVKRLMHSVAGTGPLEPVAAMWPGQVHPTMLGPRPSVAKPATPPASGPPGPRSSPPKAAAPPAVMPPAPAPSAALPTPPSATPPGAIPAQSAAPRGSPPTSQPQVDSLKEVVSALGDAVQPKLEEFIRGSRGSDAAAANRLNGELFRMKHGLEAGVPPEAGRLLMVEAIAPGLDAARLNGRINAAYNPVAAAPVPPSPAAARPVPTPSSASLDAVPFDMVRTALNATNPAAPEQKVRENFGRQYHEALAQAPDELRQLVERSGPVTKSVFVETYRAALRTADGSYATPDVKQAELRAAFRELQASIRNPPAIEARLTAFETRAAEFAKAHGHAAAPAPTASRPRATPFPAGPGRGMRGDQHDPRSGEIHEFHDRAGKSLDERRWEREQQRRQAAGQPDAPGGGAATPPVAAQEPAGLADIVRREAAAGNLRQVPTNKGTAIGFSGTEGELTELQTRLKAAGVGTTLLPPEGKDPRPLLRVKSDHTEAVKSALPFWSAGGAHLPTRDAAAARSAAATAARPPEPTAEARDKVHRAFARQLERLATVVEGQQGEEAAERVRKAIPATAEQARNLLGGVRDLAAQVEMTEQLGRLLDAPDHRAVRGLLADLARAEKPANVLAATVSFSQDEFYRRVIQAGDQDGPGWQRAKEFWEEPGRGRVHTKDIPFTDIHPEAPAGTVEKPAPPPTPQPEQPAQGAKKQGWFSRLVGGHGSDGGLHPTMSMTPGRQHQMQTEREAARRAADPLAEAVGRPGRRAESAPRSRPATAAPPPDPVTATAATGEQPPDPMKARQATPSARGAPPSTPAKSVPAGEKPGPNTVRSSLSTSMNAGIAVQGAGTLAAGVKEGDAAKMALGAGQFTTSATAAVAEARGAVKVAKGAGTAGLVVTVGADTYEVVKLARDGAPPSVVVRKAEGLAANTVGNLVTFGMAGDAPRVLTDAANDSAVELKRLMEEGLSGDLSAEDLSRRLKQVGIEDLEAGWAAVKATTPLATVRNAAEIVHAVDDIQRLTRGMENDFKPRLQTNGGPFARPETKDYPHLLSAAGQALRLGLLDDGHQENPEELRRSLGALEEKAREELATLKDGRGAGYYAASVGEMNPFIDITSHVPLQTQIHDKENDLRVIQSATAELNEFERHRAAASYLEAYPDVAAAVRAGQFENAFEHYSRYGRAEGRGWTPEAREYLARNPDVAEAIRDGRVSDAVEHYDRHGRGEGRGWSNEDRAYLDRNPDVVEAIRDGRVSDARGHYQAYGRSEARGWTDDAQAYLARNPDVAAAIRGGVIHDAGSHYKAAGRNEGRPWGPPDPHGGAVGQEAANLDSRGADAVEGALRQAGQLLRRLGVSAAEDVTASAPDLRPTPGVPASRSAGVARA